MTLADTTRANDFFTSLVNNNAQGDDANQLKQFWMSHLEQSRKSGRFLVWEDRLEKARNIAGKTNWDGYGAKPVSRVSYFAAKIFFNSLPPSVPVPEVSVDPDGELSLDWGIQGNRIFSVSLGSNSRIAYAGVFGSDHVHGETSFTGSVPPVVLENIARAGATKAGGVTP